MKRHVELRNLCNLEYNGKTDKIAILFFFFLVLRRNTLEQSKDLHGSSEAHHSQRDTGLQEGALFRSGATMLC